MVARVSPNWSFSEDKAEVNMSPFDFLNLPLT